jgi:hypothetical protein
MKQNLIFTVIAVFFFCSCEKSKTNDTLYLRGRLFLTDTITANIKGQPLAGAKVTLSSNLADTLNYEYATITNNDGYFTFNLLNEKFPYRINYEASIGGYAYKDSKTVTEGENDFAMTAQLDLNKQNGFLFFAVDSTVQAGAIPGARILVFTSEVLANSNDVAGAVYDLTSEQSGKVVKLNIQPGRYYINAKKQSGSVQLQRLKKIVDVSAKGIAGNPPVRDTMVMRFP